LLKYDFEKQFPLDGVCLSEPQMLELLEKIGRYKAEYSQIHMNSGYTSNGDGAILYGMIREFKPRKIIEVGSGYSTRTAWEASQRNQSEGGVPCRITAIEPYPRQALRNLLTSAETVALIQSKVEDVDAGLFQQLGRGDVLFIDSSHVIKTGNDVHCLYLTVLPRVPVGTLIHIHDIRFPFDYPREWLLSAKKFWTEQYLLQMFLAFNESFEILFAGNYMFRRHPQEMAEALVGLDARGPGWPGSFWIRRVK
jgi:predicted O-methyltransferase YrrM